MARTTSPLLSMDASGSVGNSLTFAKWKGRNYVRRWAIPANPRSAAQLSTRAALQYYTALYKANTADVLANFLTEAESMKISPFNAFTKKGILNWKTATFIHPENYVMFPPASESNLAIAGTANPRGISWSVTDSTGDTPIGQVICVREAASPGTDLAYAVLGGLQANSFTQTGLKPSTAYQARVWRIYANDTVKYSSSVTTVTTT